VAVPVGHEGIVGARRKIAKPQAEETCDGALGRGSTRAHRSLVSGERDALRIASLIYLPVRSSRSARYQLSCSEPPVPPQ
jgi:hypothetical protein